jgi:hypothetical protein
VPRQFQKHTWNLPGCLLFTSKISFKHSGIVARHVTYETVILAPFTLMFTGGWAEDEDRCGTRHINCKFTESHGPLMSPPTSALVHWCIDCSLVMGHPMFVPSAAPLPFVNHKVQLNSYVLYNLLSQKKRDKLERKRAAENWGGTFLVKKYFQRIKLSVKRRS